jgi:hypothetical protein
VVNMTLHTTGQRSYCCLVPRTFKVPVNGHNFSHQQRPEGPDHRHAGITPSSSGHRSRHEDGPAAMLDDAVSSVGKQLFSHVDDF